MSWASATVVSVHQRRDDGTGVSARDGEEEVEDMAATIYGNRQFRILTVPEVT
jgi:hypothetical protein